MADYIDNGGSLIMLPYTFFQDPWSLGGRFLNASFSPYTYVPNSNLAKSYTGGSVHTIFDNVGSYNPTHAMLPNLTLGAEELAQYDDGTPFVALKGNVLAINSFIPFSTSGGIGKLLSNSINFMAPDIDPPTISGPSDTTLEFGQSGLSLSWTLIDEFPDTYEVRMNTTIIQTDTWMDNQVVSISLDGLAVGNYTFKTTANDTSGLSATNVVMLQVIDTTSPVISSPSDLTIEQGTINDSVIWTPTVDPDIYQIWFGNHSEDGNMRIGLHVLELIASGSWNSGTPIEFVIDLYSVGIYNLTISLYDKSGNSVSDVVIVSIQDTTSPTLNEPDDLRFTIFDFDRNITWTLMDLNPATFEIFKNSSSISQATWESGDNIIIDLDLLNEGYYMFQIIVEDLYGNTVEDIVVVSILNPGIPIISSPDDKIILEGSTNEQIIWDVDDDNPTDYLLLQNGIVIVNDTWATLFIIKVGLGSYPRGFYQFSLTLFDASGNNSSDIVDVTVLEANVILQTQSKDVGGSLLGQIDPITLAMIGGSILIASTSLIIIRRR